MTFEECLRAAAADPELLRQFDRLRGTNLSRRGAPLDLAIDEATGRLEADVADFADFVREFVWSRMPP